MKLIFAGTRGEIEEENEKHKYHSSLILEESNCSILIDIGVKHSEKLYSQINSFDAILITHAHPDHYLWTTIKDNFITVPVYLTFDTLNYSNNKPLNFRIFEAQVKFKIKHFEIAAFDVIHSLRCPAVCFKIKGLEKQVLYAPDILDTAQPKDVVFSNIDVLIADGSSFDINLVRNRDGKLFGHAMIKTIINWCKKYNVKQLIITHCGKQIVSGNEEELFKKILNIAENKLKVLIAFDGMELEI